MSTRQLVALGLGRGAIRHRRELGRLRPVHNGVYAVGHARLTARGRWMAAVLACGPDAFLSHRSAAALWGVAQSAAMRIDVTTTRSRHPQPGIAVHRTRMLHSNDRALRDGIPVTSVARTLLDLAEIVQPQRLERAFEEAERLDLLDMRELRRLCERSHGRHSLKAISPLLAQRAPAPPTRSELERRFTVLIRSAGLLTPVVNATVQGLEVDMLWPQQMLVVELDGYAFHRHRAAFERDRDRALVLEAAGYRVLRVTWRALVESPSLVIQAVRRRLEQAA